MPRYYTYFVNHPSENHEDPRWMYMDKGVAGCIEIERWSQPPNPLRLCLARPLDNMTPDNGYYAISGAQFLQLLPVEQLEKMMKRYVDFWMDIEKIQGLTFHNGIRT